jgi:phage gpG-like protein
MTTRVAVVIDKAQMARVRRVLGSMRAPKVAKVTSSFLLQAAELVLTDAAQNQIIRGGRFRAAPGPRGGKGKLRNTKPHPSKLTSRSGELRRSLSVNRGRDRSGLPRYVDVGSDLVYARVHELGLGSYPKRAFLAPAVAAVSPRFEGLLLGELEKAVTEAAR